MKALVFKDSGKSFLTNVKKPVIDESEILMKVRACAICGTDIKLEKGSSTKLTKHGIKNMPFPRVTGHEIAGTIEELGKKVKGYVVGDRINVAPVIPCMKCEFCKMGHEEICEEKITIGFDIDGGFAQYLKIPEIAIRAGCVNKIVNNLSFEEATFTEPLAVVLNSQERSKVKSGDSILIIGAGPIGILQMQVAKYKKVSKIIIAEISKNRLNFAKKFRPDVLINSGKDNFVDTVLDSTSGDGVDVVMICASAKKLFSDSLKVANRLGRINYFAGLSKDDSMVSIDANLIHYNQLEITGTSDSTPSQNKRAMELLNNGAIKVDSLITQKLPLEEFYEGLELARSGEVMKVVINI